MVNKSELKTEEEDVLVTIELDPYEENSRKNDSRYINGAS